MKKKPKIGLKIISVELNKVNGGSFSIITQKNNNRCSLLLCQEVKF